MSHFSVLVITDEAPTSGVLEKLMAPYHEFECTGVDDQYVQDIDRTAELMAEWKEETDVIQGPDGTIHRWGDEQFYRPPTYEERKEIGPLAGTGWGRGMHWLSKDWGNGYETRVHYIPEGFTEVKAPRGEVVSFLDYCLENCGPRRTEGEPLSSDTKYGYTLVDENDVVVKAVRRTNPNAKWDWWVVGGRYSSRLQLKAGAIATAEGHPSWVYDETGVPPGVDSAQVGDIDFDAILAANRKARRENVQRAMEELGCSREELQAYITEKNEAHAKWMELEEPKPRGAEYSTWCAENGFELTAKHQDKSWYVPECDNLDDYENTTDTLGSFAVLKDGKWYERGEMGWWACVSNENDNWDEEFNKLIADLKPEQYLTYVDCHI